MSDDAVGTMFQFMAVVGVAFVFLAIFVDKINYDKRRGENNEHL